MNVSCSNTATLWAHWKNVATDMGIDEVFTYMDKHGLQWEYWREAKSLSDDNSINLKCSCDLMCWRSVVATGKKETVLYQKQRILQVQQM